MQNALKHRKKAQKGKKSIFLHAWTVFPGGGGKDGPINEDLSVRIERLCNVTSAGNGRFTTLCFDSLQD